MRNQFAKCIGTTSCGPEQQTSAPCNICCSFILPGRMAPFSACRRVIHCLIKRAVLGWQIPAGCGEWWCTDVLTEMDWWVGGKGECFIPSSTLTHRKQPVNSEKRGGGEKKKKRNPTQVKLITIFRSSQIPGGRFCHVISSNGVRGRWIVFFLMTCMLPCSFVCFIVVFCGRQG